jgi:hypothetical protein
MVERRQSERRAVLVSAKFVAEELAITGLIINVNASGVFFAARIIVEADEIGTLYIGDPIKPSAVKVRVVWVRPATHSEGSGMGLVLVDPAATSVLKALADDFES